MKRLNNKGFSMIELLVVLLIIGVLAAVAAPIFSGNSDRAIVSEAVGTLGAIRSAQRNAFSQTSAYVAVADGTTYFRTGSANNGLLGVTVHLSSYFSPRSFTVAVPGAFTNGGGATSQDFVITATGANSQDLGADPTDGARNAARVNGVIVQMDNTGLVRYQMTAGGAWQTY